jgi:3-oxoacyl-[acyl-carrier protein] reductase
MDLGLKDRVALVMASSQGLGKASALSLAREGTNLLICARREGPLRETQQQIQKETGVRVAAVQADLSRAEDISRVVKATMDEYGRIDVLITNSGPPASGDLLNLSDEIWQSAIDNQMMSVVRVCREVFPIMRSQKWGRIIHITSTSVKQPLGHLMLSSASRMGLLGLSKITANQYAADNVLIHTICPGPFLTEAEVNFFERMSKEKGITPDEAQANWITDIPMKRIGDPREFGDVVAFLASERASYMTGTVIQVDGGRIQSMF